MTEKEKVEYLKENKTKGIAYLFLPQDVWDWIGENFNNPSLVYLAPNGKWEQFSKTDFDDYDNIVFALPDDYEAKEEPKGEWVEFDIDPKSKDFLVDVEKENSNDCNEYYFWFEVERFLRDSIDNDRGYTAFGGWQYEGSKRWYLAPVVKLKDSDYWNSYVIKESGEAKPTIPVKIRFWREAK
jgi:hypothetical protein